MEVLGNEFSEWPGAHCCTGHRSDPYCRGLQQYQTCVPSSRPLPSQGLVWRGVCLQ